MSAYYYLIQASVWLNGVVSIVLCVVFCRAGLSLRRGTGWAMSPRAMRIVAGLSAFAWLNMFMVVVPAVVGSFLYWLGTPIWLVAVVSFVLLLLILLVAPFRQMVIVATTPYEFTRLCERHGYRSFGATLVWVGMTFLNGAIISALVSGIVYVVARMLLVAPAGG